MRKLSFTQIHLIRIISDYEPNLTIRSLCDLIGVDYNNYKSVVTKVRT
jgi:hypothetical protein